MRILTLVLLVWVGLLPSATPYEELANDLEDCFTDALNSGGDCGDASKVKECYKEYFEAIVD